MVPLPVFAPNHFFGGDGGYDASMNISPTG